MSIELNKQQLENLVKVYQHFEDFSDYSVVLNDDNTITINLRLAEVPVQTSKEFKIQNYK